MTNSEPVHDWLRIGPEEWRGELMPSMVTVPPHFTDHQIAGVIQSLPHMWGRQVEALLERVTEWPPDHPARNYCLTLLDLLGVGTQHLTNAAEGLYTYQYKEAHHEAIRLTDDAEASVTTQEFQQFLRDNGLVP
jgi:hypothetical protein